MKLKQDQKKLLDWYANNFRPLPWRKNRNPYHIWISETMLQQTTTQAVKPYFKNFIELFPDLQTLAQAKEPQVLKAWAGLGYYSRARNLHKAAKMLSKLKTFPRTFEELLKFPGFGPYTSRAVVSLAFSQPVGVLDGNVIRVLSRKHNWALEWWRIPHRRTLQEQVDLWVENTPSHQMNQALMELGATICLPQNPKCVQCPWLKSCESRKTDTHRGLPLKKPKRQKEIWLWSPQVFIHRKRVALLKNNYAPFLKDQWFLPGHAKVLKRAPKKYDFRHSITHHDIYVDRKTPPLKRKPNNSDIKWVPIKEVSQWIPASLIEKTLTLSEHK